MENILDSYFDPDPDGKIQLVYYSPKIALFILSLRSKVFEISLEMALSKSMFKYLALTKLSVYGLSNYKKKLILL